MGGQVNLAEIYSASRQRVKKQQVLEEYIDKFSPDYTEASELISVILGQLRHRYEDCLGVDLEHCFKELFEALEEADGTQPRAPDEMTLAKWDAGQQWEEAEQLLRSDDERQS
jgi:hypothetical protein